MIDTSVRGDLAASIRDAARRHADRIAVECDGGQLTYAQLDRGADRVCAALAALGVRPESRVVLFVDRSAEMYVGVVGIQRAGAAYVPIDPAYPAERVALLLDDCKPAAIVTHAAVRAQLPSACGPVVVLEELRADAPAPPAASPGPSALAYVIYTSGSTGTPKGVLIEHGSVLNLLSGIDDRIPMRAGDKLLALAPLSFDMSVLDVYWPLTTGATIVAASRETAQRPAALIGLMQSARITHMQATPSTWRMLVEAGWSGSDRLIAITGGEALSTALADELLARSAQLWNLYGPTEATVWATGHRVERRGEPPTIGVPLANVAIAIADEHRRTAPDGTIGELCIGGPGVARGYLHRPELTAERFVRDAALGSADRWYRTGDLARRRADGALEFFGRSDFQVKLRGHRIELGEVEAALERLQEVRAAVAAVREDVPGDPRLVAYVTPSPDARISGGLVRRALRATLPAYMVPDAVVALEAFPLSENGKVDRRRLPAPLALPSATAIVPPRTTLEAQLTAIWEAVLGVRPIGVTDDFFDLGATSIAAARVFERIEREVGAALPLSPLFQAPTIEKLAQLIEHGGDSARWTSLVPIQSRGSLLPIFGVHGGAGTILHFHDLARRLGNERPLYAFQMRGLYGDVAPHLDVEAMAAHYVREMREIQPHGPYAVVGYCFGGIVAFEMAQQLRRAGERVALLASVNGPSPAYIKAFGGPRPADPNEPQSPPSRYGRAVFALKRRWWALQYEFRAGLRERAFDLRTRWYARRGRPLPDAWRELANYRICHVAERAYRPQPYAGDMVVIYAEPLYRRSDLGWSPLVHGTLRTCGIGGHHQNQRDALFEPKVAELAAIFEIALQDTHGQKNDDGRSA